jgi:hypothetical protein
MRVFFLVLAFLALPAVALAQQPPEAPAEREVPKLEVQQTATPPAVTVEVETETADVERAAAETAAQGQDAAAQQPGDPTQARWWWLVGAIVVAGILLAAIL